MDQVDDTCFLLPEGWAQEPRLIVLPQDDGIRVALSAG